MRQGAPIHTDWGCPAISCNEFPVNCCNVCDLMVPGVYQWSLGWEWPSASCPEHAMFVSWGVLQRVLALPWTAEAWTWGINLPGSCRWSAFLPDSLEAGLITKEIWLFLPGRPVLPLWASLWTSEPLPHVGLCREETKKQKKKQTLEAERPRFVSWMHCLQVVSPSLLLQILSFLINRWR